MIRRLIRPSKSRSRKSRLQLESLEDRLVPAFLPPVLYNIGAQASPATGNVSAEGVAVGDFNGDGAADLAVVHTADRTLNTLLNKGDGTFQAAVSYPATGIGSGLVWVSVADLNGDGKDDIAILGSKSSSDSTGEIDVFLNKGNGAFNTPVTYASGPGCRGGIVMADFNGDGKTDMAVTGMNAVSSSRSGIAIHINNGNGTFKPFTYATVSAAARCVTAADFNGDGKLDVASCDGIGYDNVVTPGDPAGVSINLGNGDGTFPAFNSANRFICVPTPVPDPAGRTVNPEFITSGDLNNDGKIDLIVSLYDHNIDVFLGNGNGTFQTAIGLDTGEYPRPVAIADVDNDGTKDLVVCNIGLSGANEEGSIAVLLGNGNGTFQPAVEYHPFDFPGWMAVADFNRDGRIDVAATRVQDGHAVGVMLGVDPTQEKNVIRSLYSVFVGRPAADAEVNAWLAALPSIGQTAVAGGIARSPEALGRLVKMWYTDYLGRTTVSTADVQPWVDNLARGDSLEQTLSAILGSAEFANRANMLVGLADPRENLVRSLDGLLLRRSPVAGELSAALSTLTTAGPVALARQILASYEFRANAARTCYGDPSLAQLPSSPWVPELLHRAAAPTAAEVSGWAGGGVDLLAIEIAIAGGVEFATAAQTSAPAPTGTRSIDGTGNDLAHSAWGSAGVDLLRNAPAAYANGLSAPAGGTRLGARDISNALAAQPSDTEENSRSMSAFVYAWGQFIDHDLDLTDIASPSQPFNIPVSPGDPQFDPAATGTKVIPLSRSVSDPATGTTNARQQVNSITAWLDGSMVYGSDAARAAALRTLSGGQLQTSAGNMLPFNTAGLPNANDAHIVPDNQLFLAGDVRANENVELTALQTLFVREHNRLAAQIAAANPTFTDEQIYQQARAAVVAELQSITYNEFLPALLGPAAPGAYPGYNPNINPGIANEFSAAAYRFGHSMVGDDVQFLDNDGHTVAPSIPLSQAFFNPPVVTQSGIDPILKYLASDRAQEIDPLVVNSLRNMLFGPPGSGGMDLAALNIQRGRDHGLADYNSVRVAYGLPAVASFADITSDAGLQQKLRSVYGDVNSIDLWVGGLAESHLPGASVGPTFARIIAGQFERLRDADRFWYENVLSGASLAAARQTTLAAVLRNNTTNTNLQGNVFFFDPAITGTVFADRNADGVRQANEAGQAGVRVSLTNGFGGTLATVLTAADGSYRFADIDLARYTITLADPSRLTTTLPGAIDVTHGGSVSAGAIGVLSGNAAYVRSLYTEFLRRPGDLSSAGDAGAWVAQLDAGVPADTVARSIVRSGESLGFLVNDLYTRHLGRPADAAGRAEFVRQLSAGVTLEEVTGSIVDSPEYAAAFPTTSSFINSLYLSLLGRPPAASELTDWTALLSTTSRQSAAIQIAKSAEHRAREVRAYYSTLLLRTSAPSQAEVDSHVNSGIDLLSLQTIFASSAEFQHR